MVKQPSLKMIWLKSIPLGDSGRGSVSRQSTGKLPVFPQFSGEDMGINTVFF